MMQTARCLCFLTLLSACGPADSNDDKSGQTDPNNSSANNDGAGTTEILPDGYDSVAAGRFSPDGTRLAMVGTPPGDAPDELIVTDLSGGNVEVLVAEGLSYLTTIAWMPDGESVVYGGGGGIMQVALDASEPVLLVDSFAVESVDLSPDGALVTWSVNGGTTITTAPLSAAPTATEEHIDGPTGDVPKFTRDGARIVYVSSEGVSLSLPNGDDVQSFDVPTHFFSTLAWRDDDTLIALTEFGLTSVDIGTGEVSDLVEQFAAIDLDVSPDGSRFVVGVNGQRSLQLGSFSR